MKKTSLLIATALLSLLTGCSSSPKVSADYSEAYDFTQIKNYYLVPVKNQSDGIGLAEQRITKGIEQYLSQKNIAATEKNKADIWISYYLTSKDKTKVRNYNTSFSYGYSRNYRYGGINMGNNVDIQHYTEGQLILDLVDPKTNNVVWRGVGTKKLDPKSTPAENQKVTEQYIEALFNQVPSWQPQK